MATKHKKFSYRHRCQRVCMRAYTLLCPTRTHLSFWLLQNHPPLRARFNGALHCLMYEHASTVYLFLHAWAEYSTQTHLCKAHAISLSSRFSLVCVCEQKTRLFYAFSFLESFFSLFLCRLCLFLVRCHAFFAFAGCLPFLQAYKSLTSFTSTNRRKIAYRKRRNERNTKNECARARKIKEPERKYRAQHKCEKTAGEGDEWERPKEQNCTILSCTTELPHLFRSCNIK